MAYMLASLASLILVYSSKAWAYFVIDAHSLQIPDRFAFPGHPAAERLSVPVSQGRTSDLCPTEDRDGPGVDRLRQYSSQQNSNHAGNRGY